MTDNKCNPYGQLQIINGKFANKIYSLEPGCFRVGSSAEAEIRIQNNNIQSTQFKIKVDANKLATVCAQSFLFPATKINDKLLRKNKPEVLKPLDIIEFGDVQLQYQNSTLTEKEIKENASSVLKPIIDFDTAKWSARKSPRKLFPHKSGSLATKLKATTPVAKIPNSRLPSTIKIPGLKSLSTPYTTKSNTKTPSIDTRNILTPKQTAVKALKSATKLKYINKFPRQIQNSGKKTFIPKLMSSTKKRKSRLLRESLPKSTVTSASDLPQSTEMNISTNTPLSKIASTCDVSLLENESMVSIGKDLSSPNVSGKSLIDDKESPSFIDITTTSFTHIKHFDLSNRYLNENDNKKDTNSSNKDVSGIIPFESIFNEQSENKEFEKEIVNITTTINLEMVKENVQSLDLENVITSNLNINHTNVTVRSKRLLSSNLIDSSNFDELCGNSNKDLSDYDKDSKKIGKPLRRSRIQSLPPSACKSEEFSTENLVTCKSSSIIDDTENKHVEHLDKQSKRCNIRSRHLSFYNENNNELPDKDLPLPYKSCASTQNLLYNYELKKPTFLNSTELCCKTPANSPIDNSKRMTKHTLSGTGSKLSLLEISSGSVSDGEMFSATSNFTPQIRGKNEIKSKSVERSIRLSKINSVLDKSTSNIIDDAEISVRRRQSELNKYSNIKTYSNKKNTSKVSPQTKLDNLDTTKNNSVTGINSTFILTKNLSQSFSSLATASIETCLNNSDNFQMSSNEDDENQIQSINIKITTSTPQGEYTKINVKRSSRVSLIENDTSIEETTEDEDQYDTNNDVNVTPTSDTTLDSEKNDSFVEPSLQDTSIEIIKDECALVYTINSSTGTSLNESTDSVREENNVAKCRPSSALVTYSPSDNSEPEYYSNVSGTPVKSICKRSKEESSNFGIHEESGRWDLETDDTSDIQLSLLEKSESIDQEKASSGEDKVTHNDIKEIKLSSPAHVEIRIEDYDEITAPICNDDLILQKKNEPLRKSSLKRFSISEDTNNTNDSLKDLNFIKNKNQNDEFLNENNEEENSISIDNNVNSESKSENELKSPNKSSSSSMNQSKKVNITDIDIVSDSSEYGCKQLSFCASPSTSATSVKYGLYTDTESKKTPENDISFKKLNSSLEFYDKHRTKRRGVKRMNFSSLSEKKLKRLRKFSAPIFMSDNDTLNAAVTPKLNQSSQNDSFNRKRSKRSLRKSRLRHSLKTDVGLTGIKRLMATPKLQRSPENDLRDVRGVRRLLTTPKRQISPTNDLHDVRGVKKLLKTPKVQRFPKNELEDMRGVRKLMRNSIARRSPVNDLSDVKGVKRLMRTPRAQKSPYNDLTRVSNIRKLFRTTGKGAKKLKDKAASNNTKTDYCDVRGVKRMFLEEEANQRNELTVSGVSRLFDDESSSSQAFDKLINKKHIRTYPGKSPSPLKVRDSLLTTDTVKTPVSRDVFKWVEQQSEFVGKNDESINYNRFKYSFLTMTLTLIRVIKIHQKEKVIKL